jgi:hypothetical protein
MFAALRCTAVLSLALACAGACAQSPEATDTNVARCAAAASLKLEASGVEGRVVASVTADRAKATIDRWEAPFSRDNAQSVATLISVPLLIAYADGRNPPRAFATARCGFTSGRLLALEIVPLAMPGK